MFTSQEWISEEKISVPFDALKERLIKWKAIRDAKSLECASPVSPPSPVQLNNKNQSHFCVEDDDDLEEYEQCSDLINAYSMIEA